MTLTSFSRRKPPLQFTLLQSALFVLTGLFTPFAWAQPEDAPSSGGLLSSLFSMIGAMALFALIVGLIAPNTFRFLFKEKTTRKRVGWTFAGVMIGCSLLSGMTTPKAGTTPIANSASSAQTNAESATRQAESRAKAAEARAVRAEKAAASANAAAKSARKVASAQSESQNEPQSEEPSAPQAAPVDESLPSNVTETNIPGVGKRQIGVVDKVEYAVLTAETTSTIGTTRADGQFFVLRVVASNTDRKTHAVSTLLMKLLDDQEREFDPSSQGSMALAMSGDESAQMFSAQVQPGVIKKFSLVYDVPADVKGLKLKIPSGTFSLSPDAVIKVPTADE